jgi:hypothetical protein
VADNPRALKPIDDACSHSPFPHDAAALGNMRTDQVPRFFGCLTNSEDLEDKTVRLATLTAMQNRVAHGKVEAMRGEGKPDKKPVVVRMNGRNYIADGHHRLAAQWMDGNATADVKYKDLEPKDNALKSDVQFNNVFKIDEEERMAYGWASVISEEDGRVIDLAEDVIFPDELRRCTTDFMLNARMAMVMHERNAEGEIEEDMRKGVVVHSLPLTYEIANALGIQASREGWIVGVNVLDDDVWELVKSGRLSSFSIGCRAVREEIDMSEVEGAMADIVPKQIAPVSNEMMGVEKTFAQLFAGVRAGLGKN